jgi:hypothetical protein
LAKLTKIFPAKNVEIEVKKLYISSLLAIAMSVAGSLAILILMMR